MGALESPLLLVPRQPFVRGLNATKGRMVVEQKHEVTVSIVLVTVPIETPDGVIKNGSKSNFLSCIAHDCWARRAYVSV